jgi:hypothetical protein
MTFAEFIKPPESLKHLYDWHKIVIMIAAPVGIVTYLMVEDKRTGTHIGVGAVLAALLTYFVWRLLFVRYKTKREALEALRVSPQNDKVDALHASNVFEFWLVAFLLLSGLGLGVSFAYPVLVDLFTRRTPLAVGIKDVSYLSSDHLDLLRDAPFLEAVKVYLQDQAKHENQQPQVLLLWSKPIGHPTPEFLIRFNVPVGFNRIDGYAFRIHELVNKRSYEPLPVDYSKPGVVAFNVGPMASKDELMFIGRIVPTANPDELKQIELTVPQREPQ